MNAISRRDFAAGLSGIILAFTLAPRLALAQQPARLPGSLDNNRLLDAWIRIGTDGNATVCTGKVELSMRLRMPHSTAFARSAGNSPIGTTGRRAMACRLRRAAR